MLEALPAELREQVEQAWNDKEVKPSTSFYQSTPLQTDSNAPSVLLHLSKQPGQTGSAGIVLELPDFSQVTFTFDF